MSFVGAKTVALTGTGAIGTKIDVPVSLGGLTPKVVKVRMVGRTETSDAASAQGVTLCEGFGVSNSSFRSVGSWLQNAVGGGGYRSGRNDCILHSFTSAGTNGKLSIDTLSADNIRFDVVQQFGTNYAFEVEAWSGSDITHASVGTFQLDTNTTGAQAVTVGHPSRYVELMCSLQDGSVAQDAYLVLGRCWVPDLANQVYSHQSTNTSPTNIRSYTNDVECFGFCAFNSTAVNSRAAVSASDATTFTLNKLDALGAGNFPVYYLVVNGTFRGKMGQALTETGGSSITFDPGFVPVLTHINSSCGPENAVDVASVSLRCSRGSMTGQFGDQQLCSALSSANNVSPATTGSAVGYSAVYRNVNFAGSIVGEMVAFNPGVPATPTTVTLLMVTPDPAQNPFWWTAFGDAAPAVAAPTDTARGWLNRSISRKAA